MGRSNVLATSNSNIFINFNNVEDFINEPKSEKSSFLGK